MGGMSMDKLGALAKIANSAGMNGGGKMGSGELNDVIKQMGQGLGAITKAMEATDTGENASNGSMMGDMQSLSKVFDGMGSMSGAAGKLLPGAGQDAMQGVQKLMGMMSALVSNIDPGKGLSSAQKDNLSDAGVDPDKAQDFSNDGAGNSAAEDSVSKDDTSIDVKHSAVAGDGHVTLTAEVGPGGDKLSSDMLTDNQREQLGDSTTTGMKAWLDNWSNDSENGTDFEQTADHNCFKLAEPGKTDALNDEMENGYTSKHSGEKVPGIGSGAKDGADKGLDDIKGQDSDMPESASISEMGSGSGVSDVSSDIDMSAGADSMSLSM